MVRVYRVAAALIALPVCGASLLEGGQPCVGNAVCEDDVSSLLQLLRVQREQLSAFSAQGEGEHRECPSVGFSASITDRTLDYIMRQLLPFAYTDIQDGLMPLGPINGTKSGFDYEFKNARVASIAAGDSVFRFAPGQGLDFHVSNIGLSVSVEYMIKSSSWWTKAFGRHTGTVSVSIGSGAFVSALVGFSKDHTTQHSLLHLSDVDFLLVFTDISFDGGILASFVETIVNIFKPIIQYYIQEALKKEIASISMDLTAIFDSVMAGLHLPFPLVNKTGPNPYALDLRICGVETGSNHLTVQAYAGLNTSSPVFTEESFDLNTTGFRLSQDSMFSVALTDWETNIFTWLLRTHTGVLGQEFASEAPAQITADADHLSSGSELQDQRSSGSELQVATGQQAQVAAVDSVMKAAGVMMGVQLDDPTVRVFEKALEIVANVTVDLRMFIDSLLGPVAQHIKLGGEAARVMGELGAYP